MSTAAITTASTTTSANGNNLSFQQFRRQDLTTLSDALQSGNLTLAQSAFTAASSLTSTYGKGPFPRVPGLADDFNAVGTALKNGDLAGAQAAGRKLVSDGRAFLQSIRDGHEVPPDVVLQVSPVSPTASPAVPTRASAAATSATPVASSEATQSTETAPVDLHI